MSQNEAVFYNKLKPLPFRVLKLLIYTVIGVLQELQSASSPGIPQSLFILSGKWVAAFLHCHAVPCPSARGKQYWQAARRDKCLWRHPQAHFTPVILDEMSLLWQQAVDWIFQVLISLYRSQKKIYFLIITHEMPSLQTPEVLLICFSAHQLSAHSCTCP